MGIALADAAAEYGANVDSVLGPVNIRPQNNQLKLSMSLLLHQWQPNVISRFPVCDIAILAAAVADYTPEKVSGKKIKKEESEFVLKLKPTTDIAEPWENKETISASCRICAGN